MDRTRADVMFASAAEVLGALVDRTVTPGPSATAASEASIRVEPQTVATISHIPSAGVSFISQYEKRALAQVVEVMLGTPAGDGEMDAMQLSIVSETVAQISSAMAERLTQELKVASSNITSEVPTEASAFPPPPFTAFEATLDIAGEFTLALTLAFDGVALAAMEPPAAPARPAPRPAAPAPPSQPAGFSPMAPTPIRAAPPGQSNLDLVHDIPLEISAVLGQTAMSLRDVVALQNGSVLELDKLSTDPIDLYVNNILIARGEVVVVDEKFAVKISELNPVVDKV